MRFNRRNSEKYICTCLCTLKQLGGYNYKHIAHISIPTRIYKKAKALYVY